MYIVLQHYNGFDIFRYPNERIGCYIKIKDNQFLPCRSIAEAKRRIDFHNKYPEYGTKSFLDIKE